MGFEEDGGDWGWWGQCLAGIVWCEPWEELGVGRRLLKTLGSRGHSFRLFFSFPRPFFYG